jgi:chromosome segregation ATPase
MLLEEEQLRAAAQRRTTEAGVANARAEVASCKQQEAEAREQLNTALAELDAKVECDRATYEQAVEECAAECDRLNGLIQEALEQVKFMRAQAEAKILSGKEDAGDMFARLDKMLQRLAELVNPS